jgi:hypothetical protein
MVNVNDLAGMERSLILLKYFGKRRKAEING